MAYTVTAKNGGETISIDAMSAREARDTYLHLYRQTFQKIAIKNEDGSALDFERLSYLCELVED